MINQNQKKVSTNSPNIGLTLEESLQPTSLAYNSLDNQSNPEVTVSINIKEICYGQRPLPNTEVVSVLNGHKTTYEIPMNLPIEKKFAKIEDEMIFKLAVTSNHDLIGFLYLEIPKKFKTMKRFKLDDWFPIKRLETEHNFKEKDSFQTHQAKIVIDYQANRKMEGIKLLKSNLPKADLYKDLGQNLKDKIDQLNSKIDAFDEEGFKHLDVFQQKLIKNKIKSGSKDKEAKKTVKVNQNQTKLLDAQKDYFYRTHNGTVEDETAKNITNYSTQGSTVNRNVKVGKTNDNIPEECEKCDKLLKELSYSNQELIQTNNKISNLEQSKMTPANKQLKKEIENLQLELTKDRREINIKLKEAQVGLDSQTIKLKANFEKEKEKALNFQQEASHLQQELIERLKAVELKEKMTTKKKDGHSIRENKVDEKQAKITNNIEKILKEKGELESEFKDMDEMKNRMMLERQRVFEETVRLSELKQETLVKSNQMTGLEDFLEEEKETYKKDLEKKGQEIEYMKAELEKRKRLQELEIKTWDENLKDFARKAKEFAENMSKHRIEIARLAREKNNHAAQIEEFLETKKILEAEKEMGDQEITNNYDYIDEQTNNLLLQKKEYNMLLKKLNEFETNINNQGKQLHEQKSRFTTLQKQFFRKLQDQSCDLKELKKFAEEVGVNITFADDKFKNALNLEKDIQKARVSVRLDLENMSDAKSREGVPNDKKSTVEKKFTNKMKDTLSVVAANSTADNKMRFVQDASVILDKIFSEASLTVFKSQNVNKQGIIESLREKIENLQIQIKTLADKNMNTKVNFLSGFEYLEELGLKPAELSPKEESVKKDKNESDDDEDEDSDEDEEEEKTQEIVQPVEESFKVLQTEEEKLHELRETVEDLCDATLQQMDQELQLGVQIARSDEKVKFLLSLRRCADEIFKVILEINSASREKEAEFSTHFNFKFDMHDFEKLKFKFEEKLKALIEFIHKIKVNNDFFNPNIDGGIFSN